METQDSERSAKGTSLQQGIAIASLLGGIVLWLTSLGFQGVTGYGPTEGADGMMILLFGWFYPAWWANPIIVLSLVLLAFTRSYDFAYLLTCIAVALSFSTFLLEEFPGNNGPVFGLGLGALLWLVSIQLVAFGALSVGPLSKPRASIQRHKELLALLAVLCATVVGLITTAFVQKRAVNSEERPYFEASLTYRTFIKLSPVCRLEQPSPEPLSLTSRSLGLGSWLPSSGNWKPAHVDFLLRAGISPLLFDEKEVFATDPTVGVTAVRPRSIKQPSVFLNVDSASRLSAPWANKGTRLSLRTNEPEPQIREFTWWKQERASRRTCPRSRPDYKKIGTSSERFVVAAMGDIDRGNTFPGEHVTQKSFRIVSKEMNASSDFERVSIAPTCEGKLRYEKLGYKDRLEWSGLRGLGPLHNGTGDTVFFLTLFGEVHGLFMTCHENLLLAVADVFYARALDVLLIERESMQVRRWLRVDSPSNQGYRASWRIDNAELLNKDVRIHLSYTIKTKEGPRRTEAELILGLY